jgi:predicted MPP superfamily phosphohydrolase
VRIIIFAIIFLAVFALLNIYIVKRFINHLHLSHKVKNYFKYFLFVNYVGIVGYIYARYNPNISDTVYFLLSLPIGVIFLLFCTAIVYDISRIALNKSPMTHERRNFFKRFLDFTALGMATGLSARAIYEAKHIEVEKVDIKIKGLKQPYKIVQLSDIHIGGLIDQKFMRDLVNRVNTLNPDIVVITGDLVDIKIEYAKPALDELKNLKNNYGCYFIVGNHEYFHGIEHIIDAVKERGITVLENSSSFIGDDQNGFNLCGVYDLMGNRVEHHQPDLNKALEYIDLNRPVVLLAHQPRFINEVDSRVDLVLSGHTHGGQIYPFRLLVKLQQPYIAGLYKHNDTTQIYVNKGTGFWGPPMRLGASSEITLLKLS